MKVTTPLLFVIATSFALAMGQTTNSSGNEAGSNSAPPAPSTPAPVVDCSPQSVKPSYPPQKLNLSNCIVVEFTAYLSIGEGKYVPLKDGKVDPTNTGNRCHLANTAQTPAITIDYPCGQININFNRAPDMKTYVSSILGKYNSGGTTEPFANTSRNFVTTQTGRYYKCNSEQTIFMDKPGYALHFSDVQLEAYKDTPGTDFYSIPEECALDSQPVSDLVRIGVGICLIALVAIVLVAYFIGRRRWSERSSYESV